MFGSTLHQFLCSKAILTKLPDQFCKPDQPRNFARDIVFSMGQGHCPNNGECKKSRSENETNLSRCVTKGKEEDLKTLIRVDFLAFLIEILLIY